MKTRVEKEICQRSIFQGSKYRISVPLITGSGGNFGKVRGRKATFEVLYCTQWLKAQDLCTWLLLVLIGSPTIGPLWNGTFGPYFELGGGAITGKIGPQRNPIKRQPPHPIPPKVCSAQRGLYAWLSEPEMDGSWKLCFAYCSFHFSLHWGRRGGAPCIWTCMIIKSIWEGPPPGPMTSQISISPSQ